MTRDQVLKKVVLAIIAISLIGLATWFGFHSRDRSANGAGFGHDGGPVAVTTITTTLGEVPISEQLPGRTVAHRLSEVRPQVGGIIEKRLFKEGSDVAEGQQLYQLDSSRYQALMQSAGATLEQARASEHIAELKADRYKRLIGTKAISQQDYDDAEATLAQARAGVSVANAAVRTAKLNLNYTKVYAPISGRIGKSMVTEGALVTANQAQSLAVITQLDPIYVDIQQSSTENMRLRRELGRTDKISVSLAADGENGAYTQQGVLQFSDVSVDASTGSVNLRALFPNPQHLLLPGMFVMTTLHIGVDKAIALPQQAVSHNLDGEAYVWTVAKDNTAHQQIVTLGRAYKGEWVISKGLEPGDRVVIQGFQDLRPDAKVIAHAQGQQAQDKAQGQGQAQGQAQAKETGQ